MKSEMRHQLAQLPFEEKIRKVGELIRLRPRIKIDVSNSEHERANGARSGGQSKGLPGGRALREVNARQDVRKYAAEQELPDEQALQIGMEQKAKEFAVAGAEIYSKA